MARHQLICDACEIKFPCGMSATGVTMFVRKHDEHNYATGLRIELVECPSPRRSKHYDLDGLHSQAPKRVGPERPLL